MGSQTTTIHTDERASLAVIPPLEPGDRLTRAEFEQRYEAMPHRMKAELIEGIVYMPSPVRLQRRGQPQAHLVGWLVFYTGGTPGVIVGDNSTVRLDLDNEPQPEALLMIDPARGGQARVSADDYVETAPEFVAEVVASSASLALHAKRQVYRRNGVREYVVWRVLDGALDWFMLRNEVYVRLEPDAQGVIRSAVFPGLWLHTAALLHGDMASVFTTLQQGLASPEHTAFVAHIQAQGNPP